MYGFTRAAHLPHSSYVHFPTACTVQTPKRTLHERALLSPWSGDTKSAKMPRAIAVAAGAGVLTSSDGRWGIPWAYPLTASGKLAQISDEPQIIPMSLSVSVSSDAAERLSGSPALSPPGGKPGGSPAAPLRFPHGDGDGAKPSGAAAVPMASAEADSTPCAS